MKETSRMKAGDTARKGLVILAATIGTLLVISWIFVHWDLDRSISARFHSHESGWFLKEANPWYWLYRYGTIPGIALTLTALIGAVITRLRNPETHWHRYLLLVALTSILGAGLIVNGILKPYWGRPRPNQIQEFDGQYPYRHVWSPGIPGKGKSFSSGHATMGFLFVSLFYFRRKSARIAWIGGIGGLAYGTMLSVARVVQGAHFVTDCMWSLGVIWIVATVLYYHVFMIPANGNRNLRRLSRKQKRGFAVLGGLLSVVIVFAFFSRRPYYETYYFQVDNAQSKIRNLQVSLHNDFIRTRIRYSEHDPLWVLIHARGFAWPGASETPGVVSSQRSGSDHRAVYRMEKHGYFAELNHEIEVVIPMRLKDSLTVVFMDKTGRPISPN